MCCAIGQSRHDLLAADRLLQEDGDRREGPHSAARPRRPLRPPPDGPAQTGRALPSSEMAPAELRSIRTLSSPALEGEGVFITLLWLPPNHLRPSATPARFPRPSAHWPSRSGLGPAPSARSRCACNRCVSSRSRARETDSTLSWDGLDSPTWYGYRVPQTSHRNCHSLLCGPGPQSATPHCFHPDPLLFRRSAAIRATCPAHRLVGRSSPIRAVALLPIPAPHGKGKVTQGLLPPA